MTEESKGIVKSFDISSLICIQYPGFVKNVDRMLKTLGGEEHLSETYFDGCNRRIQMRYRPDDPYCHCAYADLYPTVNGLLLKVKRRRKKPNKAIEQTDLTKMDGEWQYEQHVIGIVKSMYRFDTLMDYQYLTPLLLRNAFQEVQGSSLIEKEQPLHIPPHIFARINVPGTYNYRPEPTPAPSRRKLPGGGTAARIYDEEGKETDSQYRKRRPSEALAAIFTSKTIPAKPSDKCQWIVADIRNQVPALESTFETIRKLFEMRPIWSRAAFACHISISHDRQKSVLPYFAYYWLNGPWRSLWCKLGYDPRTDPKAKNYQMLDVRLRQIKTDTIERKRGSAGYALPMISKPKRPIATVNVVPEDSEESPKSNKASDDNLPYVFTAKKLPGARQIFYQLCDIHEPEVQQIISENDGKETECTEKEGWLVNGTLARLRAILIQRIEALVQKRENEKKPETMDTCNQSETQQKSSLSRKATMPAQQEHSTDQGQLHEQGFDVTDPLNLLQMLQDDDEVEAYSIFGEDDEDSQGYS